MAMDRVSRSGFEIVYNEAPKMLLRGVLFNAPPSVRDQYAPTIAPLSLGGEGGFEDCLGANREQELHVLENFVQAMQAVPVPPRDSVVQNIAVGRQYVKDILAVARHFIPEAGESSGADQFDYFARDLATISGNISSRTVIAEPRMNPVAAAVAAPAVAAAAAAPATAAPKDEISFEAQQALDQQFLEEWLGPEDAQSAEENVTNTFRDQFETIRRAGLDSDDEEEKNEPKSPAPNSE